MNDRPVKKRKYLKKEILQIVVPIGIILIFLVFEYIGRNAIIPYFRKVISYKKIENNSVKEGDILFFGNDEWNNSWRVLKKEESRALLINEKCVKVACGDFVLDYIVVKNGCVIISSRFLLFFDSSLIMSTVRPGRVGCGGSGPNVSHTLMPSQDLAGCGAFQRSSPTGGAA